MDNHNLPLGLLLGQSFKEFRESFRSPLKGAHGGRDHFWLTLSLVLLCSVGLLLVSVYQGLLSRFADSLLGSIEGHGTPVWVTNNIRHNQLDENIYQFFANQPDVVIDTKGDAGISGKETQQAGQVDAEPKEYSGVLSDTRIFPYTEMDGESDVLFLPGYDQKIQGKAPVWQKLHSTGKQYFFGWAVNQTDPLWQWAMAQQKSATLSQQAVPTLEIVISRSQFQPFSYASYYHYLKSSNLLSTAQLSQIPEEINDYSELTHMWLGLKNGDKGRELHKFKVHWVESFPALHDIKFLFPIRLRNILKAADRFPELNYFPEADSATVQRISDVEFLDAVQSGNVAGPLKTAISGFENCLSHVIQNKGQTSWDIKIHFDKPVRQSQVDFCQKQSHFPEDAQILFNGISSHPIEVSDRRLKVPCQTVDASQWLEQSRQACRTGDDIAMAEVNPRINYSGANVYLTENKLLNDVKDALLALKIRGRQVFFLGQNYKDSLTRFGFLTKVLDWIVKPLAVCSLAFILYLFFVSFESVVDHRRIYYGAMMATGFRHRELGLIVGLQVFYAFVLAGFVSTLVVYASVLLTNSLFSLSEPAELARTNLGIVNMKLIPYLHEIFYSTTKVFLIIAAVIFTVVLASLGILLRKSVLPTDLIKT